MKKIKIGIIGGGLNSTIGNAHFAALSIDNNFEIKSGFFSRNKIINRKTQAYLNLKTTNQYNNFEEYISKEKDKVDVFLILTDTPSHLNIIKKLLAHKKPIICEKPSFSSLNELRQIQKKLTNKKNLFFPFYNYLGYSVIRDLKYKISKNQIGKIINVEITMPQQGLSKRFYRNAKIWRKKDLDLPTIQLDLFVHLLSITKYIFSGIKIKKLVANYQKSNNKLTHSSNVWAFSDKNIFFNLNCSKLKIGEKNNLSINIYGDKGAFKWSHNNPEILNYYNEFGKQIVLDRSHKEMKISREKRYNRYVMGHPSGFIEAMANYYHDIYSSIEQKKFSKDLINIKDEIFIFNTLESINKSALNSKWVYLKNT